MRVNPTGAGRPKIIIFQGKNLHFLFKTLHLYITTHRATAPPLLMISRPRISFLPPPQSLSSLPQRVPPRIAKELAIFQYKIIQNHTKSSFFRGDSPFFLRFQSKILKTLAFKLQFAVPSAQGLTPPSLNPPASHPHPPPRLAPPARRVGIQGASATGS